MIYQFSATVLNTRFFFPNINSVRVGRAFTLVELLIVIIIIAVLAAIAIPKTADAVNRNRDATNAEQLRMLNDAVTRFHTDTGVYPASLDDLLASPGSAPASGFDQNGNAVLINASDFRGPYLDRAMTDPYAGNDYDYSTTPPTVGEVDLSTDSGESTHGSGPILGGKV